MRLIAVCLVFISCSQITDRLNSESQSFSIKTSAGIDVEKVDDDCMDTNCTYVSVKSPKFDDYERATRFTERAVRKILSDHIRNGSVNTQMDDLMTQFIYDYQDFKKNFPESTTPWYLDIAARVNYASEELISLEIETDAYTGGAHTNNTILHFNINTSGQNQSTYKIIKDRDGFSKVAERWFRANKSLGEKDDLASEGYMFDNNTFQLPENIGFNNEGVILYYNDYEIASHAMGPTRITIPYSEVNQFLIYEL